MSVSVQPHGLQHARLPYPSLSPIACSNSCPLSQWCYPTISSSVIHFSCLQCCPASASFPMSQLFASGSQSIGASASVLPMNIQGWFPPGLTALISLQSKGLSGFFSSTTIWKHQFFSAQPFLLYGPTLPSIHDYQKNHSFDYWTFVAKVMSLLFNMLSRFVIAFLPRSKCLLISWLQSLSTVILEPKKIKSVTVPIFSPSICHEVMGSDAKIFVFWMLSFKAAFSLYSFTFIKMLFDSFSLSAKSWT